MEKPEEIKTEVIKEEVAARLKQAGFTTLAELANASPEELAQKAHVPVSAAERMVKAAQAEQERRKAVGQKEKTVAEEARASEQPQEPEELAAERAEREVTLLSDFVAAVTKHSGTQANVAKKLADSLVELPEFGEGLLGRAMRSKTFRARIVRRLVRQWS
jgi:hypothetical protein